LLEKTQKEIEIVDFFNSENSPNAFHCDFIDCKHLEDLSKQSEKPNFQLNFAMDLIFFCFF